MITIKQIQNNATVTDGNDTVTLGAGDSYTCSEPEEKLDFIITVDTTISGSSPSDSFILNLLWGSDSNLLIKWGDGIEQYLTPDNLSDITHQYTTGGVYDISIRGKIGGKFQVDRLKVIAVKQWGRFDFLSMESYFQGASNLASVPQNETLVLPNSRYVFTDTNLINYGKIDSSYTSNLGLYFRNSNFDYNIGSWNVARCTSMTNMFLGTSMSVANCDAILVGWTRWANGQANITLKQNVSIHMGNTDYTRGGDAEDAFNYLVNTLNWTITFG